ncbi:MAG TPA: PadR family transcriptional regulator [Acidobacteriaceae bacterium]
MPIGHRSKESSGAFQDNREHGCRNPGMGHPCTCAMGNVSRFIEPVVLRILKEKKKSYGYEIAECLSQYALTDATIEGAALYRTLRTLEANGHVISIWDEGDGPARRNYSLTKSGHTHLRDWAHLLETLGNAMMIFAREVTAQEGTTAGKRQGRSNGGR